MSKCTSEVYHGGNIMSTVVVLLLGYHRNILGVVQLGVASISIIFGAIRRNRLSDKRTLKIYILVEDDSGPDKVERKPRKALAPGSLVIRA
jgi:hypothetical protein